MTQAIAVRKGAKLLDETEYAKLLAQVREILAAGRSRAKAALEHEEVRTWYEAARAINETFRRHGGRAEYGDQTVIELAGDLGVTERYLHEILRFQRVFQIQNSSSELTLTHYRILSSVENTRRRNRLHRKAIEDKWSVPALLKEMRRLRLISGPRREIDEGEGRRLFLPDGGAAGGLEFESGQAPARKLPTKTAPLKARRGRFYTYRIERTESLHRGPAYYSVDLGFGNSHDMKLTPMIRAPKAGEIVEAIRTHKNPAGDRYRLRRIREKLKRPQDLLYTYKAFVLDVIDDDTLWADMDLGFRGSHKGKLRFRGIDAAEIGKGKEASGYVKRTLAKVPFVVLTVTGREKFGRPLADIFYLEATDDKEKVLREGRYLNQELLDLGLARRV